MIMHRGIPLSFIQEHLGEPKHRECHQSERMRATVSIHRCMDEAPWGCTAQKLGPPDCEEWPDDNWWVRPCPVHEKLFADFPIVTPGTPAWEIKE